jgi:hypothetical protein
MGRCYVWKTDKGRVGTCRKLVLEVADGSPERTLFLFFFVR